MVLCRLTLGTTTQAGKWTLPGGGIEFGEDPEETMVREVLEETGLQVRPTGLAGVDSHAFENSDGLMHAIRILYHTEIVGGALANERDGSTDQAAWVTAARAAELELVELAETGVRIALR